MLVFNQYYSATTLLTPELVFLYLQYRHHELKKKLANESESMS